MGEELKACPFCGAHKWLHQRGTQIECTECGAEGPRHGGGDVQARWNRRAPDPLKAELVEALVGARADLSGYASCYDGCTCGDGWSHDGAIRGVKAIDAALARAREGEKRG